MMNLVVSFRIWNCCDINPSIDIDSLSLNIDMDDNSLDLELAKSVGEYFQLDINAMDQIIDQVKAAVRNWNKEAGKIGIPRNEREIMTPAFEKVF